MYVYSNETLLAMMSDDTIFILFLFYPYHFTVYLYGFTQIACYRLRYNVYAAVTVNPRKWDNFNVLQQWLILFAFVLNLKCYDSKELFFLKVYIAICVKLYGEL